MICVASEKRGVVGSVCFSVLGQYAGREWRATCCMFRLFCGRAFDHVKLVVITVVVVVILILVIMMRACDVGRDLRCC